MAKILISFIGTGRPTDMVKEKPRIYNLANYHLGEDDLGKHSFISLALHKKLNFDRIILIGTSHSMWEEVYNRFRAYGDADYDEQSPDEAYWDIASTCMNNRHDSPLHIPHKEQIEAALPAGSKVVLIRYGLNEDEIKANTEIILSLASELHRNDEVIVDVTHSFRSLPLTIMQLILFLRTIQPSINVSHIYYGMLEVINEVGYAPIVDLRSILDVNDWISGAYAFQEFGSAYKIAELLKAEGENTSDANRLKGFSDEMNLNHLYAIQSEAQRLSSFANKGFANGMANLVVLPTIKNFVKEFGSIKKHSVFQFHFANWQYQHHNYCAAYLTICEAIVTYACEQKGLDENSKDVRKDVKKIMHRWIPAKMNNAYKNLKDNRNALAHSKASRRNSNKMIVQLGKELNNLSEFFH